MRRFQPIVLVEIAPEHLAAQGSTVDGLLGLVAELDYRVWIFDSEGRPCLHDGDEPLGSNVIAAPAEWSPPVIP